MTLYRIRVENPEIHGLADQFGSACAKRGYCKSGEAAEACFAEATDLFVLLNESIGTELRSMRP